MENANYCVKRTGPLQSFGCVQYMVTWHVWSSFACHQGRSRRLLSFIISQTQATRVTTFLLVLFIF